MSAWRYPMRVVHAQGRAGTPISLLLVVWISHKVDPPPLSHLRTRPWVPIPKSRIIARCGELRTRKMLASTRSNKCLFASCTRPRRRSDLLQRAWLALFLLDSSVPPFLFFFFFFFCTCLLPGMSFFERLRTRDLTTLRTQQPSFKRMEFCGRA